MRLVEVTWRHRNDFHWVGECSYCGKKQTYKDGYADDFYCSRVVPGRYCPEDNCGMNSFGQNVKDRGDISG